MMQCSDFLDQISAFVDGELPLDAAAEARHHAGACPGCAAVLASLRRTLALFAEARGFDMPAEVGLRLRQRLERDLSPSPQPEPVSAPAGWNPLRVFRLRPVWAAAVVAVGLAVGVARWRAGATTTSGWLMDRDCATTYHGQLANHSRDCLMRCQRYGYGVLDASGHFTPFDASGNRRAYAMLESATQPDHIWVTVRGTAASGHTLDVETLALSEPPTADLSQSR